jgi:hypothetical protein
MIIVPREIAIYYGKVCSNDIHLSFFRTFNVTSLIGLLMYNSEFHSFPFRVFRWPLHKDVFGPRSVVRVCSRVHSNLWRRSAVLVTGFCVLQEVLRQGQSQRHQRQPSCIFTGRLTLHTRTRKHTHMYAYTHVCTHTHVCIHTRMQAHTCMHTHTHVRTHTRTHTHTHTHTHTVYAISGGNLKKKKHLIEFTNAFNCIGGTMPKSG